MYNNAKKIKLSKELKEKKLKGIYKEDSSRKEITYAISVCGLMLLIDGHYSLGIKE